MVGVESPEWLPPGFAVKVKYKNGRRIKYYLDVATGAKYHHKKDVIQCAAQNNNVHGTPQATEQGVNGPSSGEKAETALVKTDDLSESLPSGWEVEERTRHRGSRRKDSSYKVYIESSSGRRFYSREAVAQYMSTVHHASTITADNRFDAVDNPSPDIPQDTSNTDEGSTSKKKQKAKSFKMVAVETAVDDDLPPEWIKEIRTSKSGNKIRRDPFYIEPATGYVLRSKKDVLRYLETNDIRKCAMRPLKRELYDLKKNEIPSSSPTEKSQDYKRDEESIDGRETSATKSCAESEADVLEHTPDINASDSVKVTSVGAASSAVDLKTMTVDATVCSPVIDPLPMKQEFSRNATEKQADRTQVGTRSKKRKGSTLPSRSSKRLAEREPEMRSDNATSKSSVGAAVRSSESDVDPFPSLKEASASVPLPPNMEPTKATVEARISKKPLRGTAKIEIPISEAAPGNQAAAEKQPDGSNKILQELQHQAGTEKQPDGSNNKSPESQFFSEFGESWSDPTLEFAIKTLRGEIPIEETLKFSSCFAEPFNIRNLGGGGLKSLQPHAPINFQNEFLPGSEYFKQPGSINHMPVNSPGSEYFKQPVSINHMPVNSPGSEYFKQPGPINHMAVNTPGSVYFKQPGPINHMPVNMPGSMYFKQPGPINHMPVTTPPSFGATQMPGSSLSFPAPGNISFSTCNGSKGQSSTDAGEKGRLRKP